MSSPDVLVQVTHSLSRALTPTPSSLHSPHRVPGDNIHILIIYLTSQYNILLCVHMLGNTISVLPRSF